MSAPEASKTTYTPWPLVWEILLAVAFAIMVAVGIVTVVIPELAEPPGESAPRRPGSTPQSPSGSAAATHPPGTPTPPPP